MFVKSLGWNCLGFYIHTRQPLLCRQWPWETLLYTRYFIWRCWTTRSHLLFLSFDVSFKFVTVFDSSPIVLHTLTKYNKHNSISKCLFVNYPVLDQSRQSAMKCEWPRKLKLSWKMWFILLIHFIMYT